MHQGYLANSVIRSRKWQPENVRFVGYSDGMLVSDYYLYDKPSESYSSMQQCLQTATYWIMGDRLMLIVTQTSHTEYQCDLFELQSTFCARLHQQC